MRPEIDKHGILLNIGLHPTESEIAWAIERCRAWAKGKSGRYVGLKPINAGGRMCLCQITPAYVGFILGDETDSVRKASFRKLFQLFGLIPATSEGAAA
jgi:hypothetical protein